ncbi:SUR7/PalI family-domain-containing protein [Apiosordaria backusii]|uniref:SUR7/PalI family-domain-containing protein n=1 Tax=Apiosordaria backusii TaxID=314023 RepID=A0AA40EGD4_9PEZI|nr:SUR7/PalI family-domain-containing protein [Apiosordaria backusii]
MAAGRLLLSFLALLFLSVSLLLLWFTILSGITTTSPLRQTYFLRADTSGISGARPISQWTYFRICGLDNTNCGPSRPGLPLGDAWDTDASGVPPELIGSYGGAQQVANIGTYGASAGWLACLGRLGAGIIGLVSFVGLVFLSVAVSLMTATFVKTRNAFISDGRSADLGAYGFGFSWGSWTAIESGAKRWSGSTFGNRRKSSGTAGSRRSYDGRRVKEEYA